MSQMPRVLGTLRQGCFSRGRDGLRAVARAGMYLGFWARLVQGFGS